MDGLDDYHFPPAAKARRWGPAAYGGDLAPRRLLTAYASGYFPWPEEEAGEEELLPWWSPDPRCLLPLATWTPGRTLRRLLKRHPFRLSIDRAFPAVIAGCTAARRDSQATWITPAMTDAYQELHRLGFAHSVESWLDGELVGGLYGILLQGECGLAFFGESMFHRADGASKVAFCHLVEVLRRRGAILLDCQMPNEHLLSLGALPVSRAHYLEILAGCRFSRESLNTPVGLSAEVF